MVRLLNVGCGDRHDPAWVNVDLRSTGPGVMVCDVTRGLPFADGVFDGIYHSHLLEHLPKRVAPIFLRECFRVLKEGGIARVVVPDLECIARLYLEYLEGALVGDEQAQKRYEYIVIQMLDQMVRDQPGGELLKYWRQERMPAESFVIERSGSELLNALRKLGREPDRASGCGCSASRGLGDEPKASQVAEFRLSGEIHQWMYDRYSLGVLMEAAGFDHIEVHRGDTSDIPDFNSYLLDLEADGSVRKPDSLFVEGRK